MQLDPRQWTVKQRVLFIGILVVVGVVLLIVLTRDNNRTNPTDDALTTAEKATNEGDYDQAFETLKAAEGQATTNEEKIRLYNDLAASAANAGRLQDALEYYAKKHQLDADSRKADGYLLGELYERTDDLQKAIESYKLFVDYAETIPQEEFGSAQVESLKERIKELEGQQ